MSNYTDTDFEILKILWKHKALSGKEIHDIVQKQYKWAYSTTRTVIDRMVKKELILKESFHGINLYSPRISKVQGFANQITRFAENILERDVSAVLPLFSKTEVLSKKEIEELEQILQDKENETK